MKKKQIRSTKGQRGISIIEALLSTAILASVTIGFLQIQAQTNEEAKAKRVAESTASAGEYFTNYMLTYRDGLVGAMVDGTNASQFCVVGANPTTGAGGTTANDTALHTCAVDLTWLQFKNITPLSYSATNELRQRPVAIFKLVYFDDDSNPGTPDVTDGSVEMLVGMMASGGSEQTSDASFTTSAANFIGFNGGFIPNNATWGNCTYKQTGTAAEKQGCGTSGGWNVNLNSFLTAP